jgi:hypothetical protein
MVQLFVPSTRTISARNVIIGTILVVATATLVLTLLSALGLVNMCRAGKARSGAKKQAKKQAQAQAQGQGQGQAEGQAEGQAGPKTLVEKDAKEALAQVRESGRDKIVYVLGQMSCPACQACKKYIAGNGYGDDAIFVDLVENGEMLKDGSLPKPVVQSLGRGVPCLVAFSHRAGAALKKHEGFSPKGVDELVAMVR